jgi:hypothetical protein
MNWPPEPLPYFWVTRSDAEVMVEPGGIWPAPVASEALHVDRRCGAEAPGRAVGVCAAVHDRVVAVDTLPEGLRHRGVAGGFQAEGAPQRVAALLGLTNRLADQADGLDRRVERDRENVPVVGELAEQAARQPQRHALDEAEIRVHRQARGAEPPDEAAPGPRPQADDDGFSGRLVVTGAELQPELPVELSVDRSVCRTLGAEWHRSREPGGQQSEHEPAAPDRFAPRPVLAQFVTAIHGHSPVSPIHPLDGRLRRYT